MNVTKNRNTILVFIDTNTVFSGKRFQGSQEETNIRVN